MKDKMKSIAVYCGHQMGKNKKFVKAAEKLGELMAKNKIKLVFGAGNVGLMGVIATSVVKHKGKIIGVSTPHIIAKKEPPVKGTKTEIMEKLSKRKQRMIDLADAFCILPGGIGTLDELTDILVMNQIKEMHKTIYLMNIDGYWNIFIKMLNRMKRFGFISSTKLFNIKVMNNPKKVIEHFCN